MPKNKKADTSDSDSGPDDRLPAKKSKPAGKSSAKESNSEEDLSWPIDKRRFVKLREFNRKWMVDIREYYDADGDLKPGKKGIALSIPQWQKLKEIVDEVDEAIKKNV
ncbi:RNA polymerase II transcriptional coactivator [Chrysoperla carnea]|uniref:RNA polymerase II transcriptional coactivator n=1 Tax=Chrysoperla carnea TaxID=189513 RepID=UPI001D08D195|nr:RNA polymerase II transcriptional coactivator [Chrysoperla carnea]